jgi:rod shape-determining protein MreC
MPKKGLFGIVLAAILTLFLYLFSTPIQERVLSFSNGIKTIVLDKKNELYTFIYRHYNQAKTIEKLQNQVKELEPKASLSVAFASKLNSLLSDLNMSSYEPELIPIKVLSYEKLNNPNRLYIEFPNFDEDRQYGLVYEGVVAGIIEAKASQPVAILLPDPNSVFSVLIGDDSIEGVAFGAGEYIEIRYIPTYKDPKVGDEVITSGYDKLFYHGIRVGEVIRVEKKLMYKVATVKPYLTSKIPQFLYGVDVK